MTEIYYAEDDEAIAKTVKEYLEGRGCRVILSGRLAQIRQALKSRLPDLVLIDWNMPDGQGDDLCRWIRERWRELPVILITVRGDSCDMITGFQGGADDYVVKPFDLDVLYSRILALLRRAGQAGGSCFYCDGLALDTEKKAAFCGEEEIALSQPEYQVFALLMKNKGKTVTRKLLLEEVWDSNGVFVNDNTLTVTMKRLREKLGNPACLKTIRSFGYRMEDTL